MTGLRRLSVAVSIVVFGYVAAESFGVLAVAWIVAIAAFLYVLTHAYRHATVADERELDLSREADEALRQKLSALELRRRKEVA